MRTAKNQTQARAWQERWIKIQSGCNQIKLIRSMLVCKLPLSHPRGNQDLNKMQTPPRKLPERSSCPSILPSLLRHGGNPDSIKSNLQIRKNKTYLRHAYVQAFVPPLSHHGGLLDRDTIKIHNNRQRQLQEQRNEEAEEKSKLVSPIIISAGLARYKQQQSYGTAALSCI